MTDKHFVFFDLADPGDESRVTWKGYLRFRRSQGEPPPQSCSGVLVVSGTASEEEMNSLRQAWMRSRHTMMISASVYAHTFSTPQTYSVTAPFRVA